MTLVSIGEKSDLIRVSKPGGGGVQGRVVEATWRTSNFKRTEIKERKSANQKQKARWLGGSG
jgi:hypothetical protein